MKKKSTDNKTATLGKPLGRPKSTNQTKSDRSSSQGEKKGPSKPAKPVAIRSISLAPDKKEEKDPAKGGEASLPEKLDMDLTPVSVDASEPVVLSPSNASDAVPENAPANAPGEDPAEENPTDEYPAQSARPTDANPLDPEEETSIYKEGLHAEVKKDGNAEIQLTPRTSKLNLDANLASLEDNKPKLRQRAAPGLSYGQAAVLVLCTVLVMCAIGAFILYYDGGWNPPILENQSPAGFVPQSMPQGSEGKVQRPKVMDQQAAGAVESQQHAQEPVEQAAAGKEIEEEPALSDLPAEEGEDTPDPDPSEDDSSAIEDQDDDGQDEESETRRKRRKKRGRKKKSASSRNLTANPF